MRNKITKRVGIFYYSIFMQICSLICRLLMSVNQEIQKREEKYIKNKLKRIKTNCG